MQLMTDRRFKRKLSKRILDDFSVLAPSSAGPKEELARLTSLASEQIFPLLLALISAAGKEYPVEPIEAEDFAVTPGQRKAASELKVHFDIHGSDKSRHCYHHVYGAILENAEAVETIVEVGMGTNDPNVASTMGVGARPGASLRAFAQHAKNAAIFGADIDRKILFEEENIKTAYVDQTNLASFGELDGLLSERLCDLIIDDGLHSPNANLATMLFGMGRVKIGGWIVIEDIRESLLPFWKSVSSIIHPGFASFIVKAPTCYLFAAQKIG